MNETNMNDLETSEQETSSSTEAQTQSVTGRSVFLIQTGANGIEVLPGLLVDEKNVLKADALVFPDLGYALQQIDEMRALVMQHFATAARVGVQVLSQLQQTQNAETPDAQTTSVSIKEDGDA